MSPAKRPDVPEAFYHFAQWFFQDAQYFDTLDDVLRFCLQGIPRNQLKDFIAFAKRVEGGEFTDAELKDLWDHSGSDFYIRGKNGVRDFLSRAREMAEREAPSGKLYRTPIMVDGKPWG